MREGLQKMPEVVGGTASMARIDRFPYPWVKGEQASEAASRCLSNQDSVDQHIKKRLCMESAQGWQG